MKLPLLPCLALGLACATPAFASEVLLQTAQTTVDTHQLVELHVGVSTDGREVNAVQATIHYPKDLLSLTDVRDSNSVISAWIEKPTAASSTPGAYSFSGIIPNGYKGAGRELLTLDFVAQKSGIAQLEAGDLQILLNDGQGTPDSVSSTPRTLAISRTTTATSTSPEVTEDHTPPVPFTIERAQDPNLFDGKWFISFVTQDKESGIDHYEVREQKSGQPASAWTTATSPYLLQDQSRNSQVEVKALDKNGNEQLATLASPSSVTAPRSTWSAKVLSFVLILVCAFIASIFWKKHVKRS